MENSPEKEIWKDIPEYEGIYLISSQGRILSLLFHSKNRRKILKPYLTRGYEKITLFKQGKKKNFSIHQLLAMAFLNHKPVGNTLVVDHIDNNKRNNRLENIQVITNRENTTKDKDRGVSEYVGVHWFSRYSKWKSAIDIEGKRIHLGYFELETEANNAYVKALSYWEEYGLKPETRVTSSEFKGVTFNKKLGKWKSYFTLNGRSNYVGYFNDEKEAFLAKEKAKELKLSQLQL